MVMVVLVDLRLLPSAAVVLSKYAKDGSVYSKALVLLEDLLVAVLPLWVGDNCDGDRDRDGGN